MTDARTRLSASVIDWRRLSAAEIEEVLRQGIAELRRRSLKQEVDEEGPCHC